MELADTPPRALVALGLWFAWAATEGAVHVLGLFQPARPDRRRAALSALQAAFFATVVYGLLDATQLRLTTFDAAPRLTTAAGAAMVAVGVALRLWARVTMGRNFSAYVQTSDEHRLVTDGPYAWVRHPAYAGFVCFLLGFPLCFGSWGALAIGLAIGVPALAHRVRVEETALRSWFGDAYRDYARRTKRLVPRVW